MVLTIRVRETDDEVIVKIGGTDYMFSKKDKRGVRYKEGKYLTHIGQLPSRGT